jgi:hypothetical protein
MKMATINLEDTYPPIQVAEDLSYMTFYSPLKKGGSQLLKIRISHLKDNLLPNVYNLSFGPPDIYGEIDDEIKMHHEDVAKVFSTIILFSLTFMKTYKFATLGLDGSNDTRAYYYHRMFKTNRLYLGNFFVSLGVDWYVRLLRTGFVELDSEGIPFFKPKPEPFDYHRPDKDLYRYYMFHLVPE